MPTYTWKIQYSENYSDQFQQKGLIDKDKAVEEFQLFPWDKEIDDYKRRNDNPTIPKIVFDSDDKRQLVISSVSNKGYEVEYTNLTSNKYSNFYLSSDFEKKNYAPEEIIEFFFDNDIEQHLKLKDIPSIKTTNAPEYKEKKTAKNVEFNFNPKHLKTFSWGSFMWLGISIGLFVIDKIKGDSLPIFVHIVLAFTWFPAIILHLTYYFKNNSAQVIIDTRNHDLTYIKGSKEIKFNRDDIFRCQVTSTKSGKATWDNYTYVWFILNDRTYVSITCFIADPYEIVETLNCKYEEAERSIPFLPI